MARIRIPCLVGKTNKAGVTSWYWQPSATLAKAGWTAEALGKDEGVAITAARARNAEVEEWKRGGQVKRKVRDHVASGTVGALVERYRREVLNGTHPSTGRPLLGERTRETYEISLRRIEAWAGKHPVAYVTPARVRVLRDANARPPEKGGLGHSQTFNLLKQLRQLFAFAERIDVIPKGSNPARAFDFGAPPPRSHVWEADDEAAFIAAARELGLPSMALAIELAIYSGQREGDLIRFTEPQLQPLEIHDAAVRSRLAGKDGVVMGWSLAQGKTSTEHAQVLLDIPLEPTLRAKVEAAIRTNRARDRAAEPRRLVTHVLVDDRTGLPWKKRGFIQAWRNVIAKAVEMTGRAHMEELVWHDLRRTRVVRLRRRGMAPAMIASLTGHSPQSINMMLKVYGPVDPTITAAAIVAALPDPAPAKPAPRRKASAGKKAG